MVCTENEISKWEDFPKGLRVLLLDADNDTTSILRSMDYIVTTFTDEKEALSAFSSETESFHIAIVAVNAGDENKSFKFLEAAKDLPTIMTSSDRCLTTTMKCIALGAVEFLHKPLSEDKLKNIWQHVLHKAFNDGGSAVSGSLKPVMSRLHLELGNQEIDCENPQGEGSNADPAPSTPQLKQGSRLLEDGDCQENVNCSMDNVNSPSEKENTEDQDVGESKSVDTTNCTSDGNNRVVVKEEKEEGEGETDDARSESIAPRDCQLKEHDDIKDDSKPDHPSNKSSGIKNASGNKANRKKVDWTPELHKKFVKAVEELGVDQAIPSRILELMKVEGLTRHNVASHLQKFRMHRRNIIPKEDHHHDRRWIQPRETHPQFQRSFNGYSHRPVMAYPAPPMYHAWSMPGVHPRPTWPPPSPGYPPWQPPDTRHWMPPYPPVHGNAWGCPVGPPLIGPCHTSQNSVAGGFHYGTGIRTPTPNSFNFQPDEEVIDKVVKEAMTKPWLPLPLGLKPPSHDTVLAELSRQGISAVPSSSPCLINGSRIC